MYALMLQSLISFGILTHISLWPTIGVQMGSLGPPDWVVPEKWSLTLSQHPLEVLRLPIIPVCPYFIQLSLSERLFVFNGITYAS